MTAAEMADIRELRAELLENHREIRADLAALTSELRASIVAASNSAAIALQNAVETQRKFEAC